MYCTVQIFGILYAKDQDVLLVSIEYVPAVLAGDYFMTITYADSLAVTLPKDDSASSYCQDTRNNLIVLVNGDQHHNLQKKLPTGTRVRGGIA